MLYSIKAEVMTAWLCVAAMAVAVADPAAPAGGARAASVADLDQAMHLAAAYLVQNCDGDGRFTYRRHVDPSRAFGAKYNLLRHAGTIYAMAEYQARSPDQKARDALVRAAAFLRERFIGPVPGHDGLLAVWTRPADLGYPDPDAPVAAKLGGAGLALVGMLAAERVAPGTTPVETCQGLARFVRFMQQPDGSFSSKYFVETGVDKDWVSLYYPGEAMLGLIMLYERDGDLEWLRVAAAGMAYLARTREAQTSVPADHWALLATERLLQHFAALPAPRTATREQLISHAVQICEEILDAQITAPEPPTHFGAFRRDATICPAATRLEGLLATERFLPDSHAELKARIRAAADHGVAFLLRTQISEGELAGGFPRAACAKRNTPANTIFNRRVGEVRIDYVQHALSALMAYRDLVARSQTGEVNENR